MSTINRSCMTVSQVKDLITWFEILTMQGSLVGEIRLIREKYQIIVDDISIKATFYPSQVDEADFEWCYEGITNEEHLRYAIAYCEGE